MKYYELPPLSYDYDALDPVVSEAQLALHHDLHHKAYVENANIILEKLEQGRKNEEELNFAALYKELSFNVGGHVLHALYWENMTAVTGREGPPEELRALINQEFGSMERFMEEFAKTGLKVEGSGWAALTYCKKTKRLLIMQIEKHNVNVMPMFEILLVMDVWEHSYYLDYQNKRGDYIDKFWDIVNWDIVGERLKAAKGDV